MVGLLRGPAGACSQRPARHPRLGHRPDWPTQPRPEGLCRPAPISLIPPQGYFLGNSVVFGWHGGLWWSQERSASIPPDKMSPVNSAGCQRELGGTTTRALPAPGQSIV